MTSWTEKWETLIEKRRPISVIRKEHENEHSAVRSVLEAAFETKAEADLVDILREQADPYIALVEEFEDLVRGHIVFTPITHSSRSELRIAGLGPMAVLPEFQRGGIGTSLVIEGLELCESKGFGGVIVLGHLEFYPRFGFRPASHYGLECEFEVPDDVFMALELEEGYLSDADGMVRYHPAFYEV